MSFTWRLGFAAATQSKRNEHVTHKSDQAFSRSRKSIKHALYFSLGMARRIFSSFHLFKEIRYACYFHFFLRRYGMSPKRSWVGHDLVEPRTPVPLQYCMCMIFFLSFLSCAQVAKVKCLKEHWQSIIVGTSKCATGKRKKHDSN